jgi:hypothetical protein
MATLAVMKSRIASELDRTDISSQIASAILDAIAEHERERFWFNESRDLTFTTVASQRIYTTSDASWIPDVIQIDDLFATVGGQNRRLIRGDASTLELLSDNSGSSGAPSEWDYFSGGIILYPIPDQAYTVRALAHYRIAALTNDSQSNAWTTEAEQLIRRTAKIILTVDVTDDREGMMRTDPVLQANLANLRAETSRRKTRGRVEPTTF